MPTRHGLHFHESGEARAGTPLVLLHGAGGHSLGFLDLARRLGQVRHVVALDLPGHGRSEALADEAAAGLLEAYRDATGNLCAAMGFARAILLGHSMGAAIVQLAAHAWPDRVAGMILVGAGARMPVHPATPELLRKRPEDFPALVARAGYSPETPRSIAERWGAGLPACTPELAARDFEACARFDSRPFAAAMSQPALVIGGADDVLISPRKTAELAALLPRCEHLTLPRAGHFPFHEREDEVAAAISAWLAGVP